MLAVTAFCEPLERRTLLSTILWSNRGGPGSDTDAFQATYGSLATAQSARAIVDRALQDWQDVIVDFNYGGGGNTYTLSISASDLGGGGRGVTTGLAVDGDGKPTSATITMDDNGGGAGWYFDPNPSDDAEFTTLLNGFTANGPNSLNGNDYYRTFVHEVGHAMGIAIGSGLAINSLLTDTGIADPVSQDPGAATENLFLFNGASTNATMTETGGGHIYEGPSVNFNGNPLPTAPFDLMNAGRTVGFPPPTCELITDLNAYILQDAYNYTVQLPVFDQHVLRQREHDDGRVDRERRAGDSDDGITIDMDGGVRVQVNGTSETLAGIAVSSINVLADGGNDIVSVGDGVTVPTTLNGDAGNDQLFGGDVTMNGGAGNDMLHGSIGADSLAGDAGNDTLFGLDGADTLAGGADDDEIHAGTGVNSVTDGVGNDFIDLSANSAAVTYTTGGGNDTVVGTAFNDRIVGSAGNNRIDGRGGRDQINGNGGFDDLLGGADSDVFVLTAGTSTIDGGTGQDTFSVAGTSGAYSIQRAGLFNAPAALVQGPSVGRTLLAVEDVQILPPFIDPASSVLVRDLQGTDVKTVLLNRIETFGVVTTNNYTGSIAIEGTGADDNIRVADSNSFPGGAGSIATAYLPWGMVGIDDLDPGFASLTIFGLAGNDDIKVDPAARLGATTGIILDGGGGNDTLSADSTLLGGAGNDLLLGAASNDVLDGGDGDDVFVGGGGTDAVSGGSGADSILVQGTGIADTIDATFPGATLVTTTNGVSTTYLAIAAAGVEKLDVRAGDGADVIGVQLTATIDVVVDGGGDALPAVDRLNLLGTGGDDAITLNGNLVTMGGSPITATRMEVFKVDGLGGADVITYDGVNGVSEQINLVGSATPAAGRIDVPGVASFNFAGVETFDVNGNDGTLGDTDTLAVSGTNGVDRFVIKTDAAGTVPTPCSS